MNCDSRTYGTLLIPGHQTFGNTIEGGKYPWSHFFKKKKKGKIKKKKQTQKEKATTNIVRKFDHTGAAETSNREGGANSPISASSRHKQRKNHCKKHKSKLYQLQPVPLQTKANSSSTNFALTTFFLFVCI